MMIITPAVADAIGRIIASAGGTESEVVVTMDDVTIRIFGQQKSKRKEEDTNRPKRRYTKRRQKLRPGEGITWEGETHSPEEWAKKLNATKRAVIYRWNKWGTLEPHPTRSRPSDADKVIAGV